MAKASLRFVVLSFMALSLLALVLGMLEPTVETEAVGRRLSDDEISPPFPWGMPWFIVGKVKAAGPLKILGPPGVVAVLYWLLYCAGCLRECFPRNYVGSPPLEVLAFLVSGVSICWGVLYLDTFQYPDTLLAPEPEPDTWFWLVCLSVVLLALLAVLAACLARCYSAVPSLTILVFAITFPLVFTVLSPSALHLCDCGHNPTRVTGRDCVVGCCAPGFGLVDGACKALECSCAHGTLLESVCTEFGGEACSECNEGFLLHAGSCSLRTCTCQHGNPTTGTSCPHAGAEQCTKCEDGYELRQGKCNLRMCRCDNGQAANGTSCPREGASHCAQCDEGFTLHEGSCKLNECSCPHGTPARGLLCPESSAHQCTKCDDGHELLDAICLESECFAAVQGVVATSQRKGATPNQDALLPPCAKQSAYNGICTIPPRCLASLPDSNALKNATAFTKGIAPLRIGVPSQILAAISAVLVLVPISYNAVTRKPFMLQVEIAVSAGDFSSDVLNTFGNEYYGISLFLVMLAITFSAGLATIVGHYGKDLVSLLLAIYSMVAWPTWNRLVTHGMHTVFETHGDSAEKLIANLLWTIALAAMTPILILVVAPIAAIFTTVMVFLLGATLHSLRLLLLNEVLELYELILSKAIGSSLYAKMDEGKQSEEPVSKRSYHLMIFTEVMCEAGPSILVTLLNYKLMRDSFMTERLSLVASCSIGLSVYLFLRVGYKYFYHLAYLKHKFDDIPLPYNSTVSTLAAAKSNEILAAGGAAAAVGGTTTSLLEAAVVATGP